MKKPTIKELSEIDKNIFTPNDDFWELNEYSKPYYNQLKKTNFSVDEILKLNSTFFGDITDIKIEDTYNHILSKAILKHISDKECQKSFLDNLKDD